MALLLFHHEKHERHEKISNTRIKTFAAHFFVFFRVFRGFFHLNGFAILSDYPVTPR
jgi:hypothetical protein